ncbi:hypothetical protein K431DRAFT_214075 [Polychaeton citri CBS 116435]|uniref:Uncharacterized protein n=1 Tax=Polychaeton citri CBS 116435 TaxID=1314669 RepID=A0A9P4URY6_9PEZI|nr:hypothetical protein K431DRAFT_214075 [Polychaeton citri CBS 116435]
MCFYEMYQYQCRDWKWGNFRQHCQKEYRIGETCGTKLIAHTTSLPEKCKMCQKIETKQRRLAKAVDDYKRWSREPQKFKASLAKAAEEIKGLENEIKELVRDKDARYKMIGNSRR